MCYSLIDLINESRLFDHWFRLFRNSVSIILLFVHIAEITSKYKKRKIMFINTKNVNKQIKILRIYISNQLSMISSRKIFGNIRFS